MEFPTPDDPKQARVWDNYVVSQASAASLRLIPPWAHAIGVEVDGLSVTLVVQAPPGRANEDGDITDIVSELGALLGPEAAVSSRTVERESPRLRPDDGVRWFFAARP